MNNTLRHYSGKSLRSIFSVGGMEIWGRLILSFLLFLPILLLILLSLGYGINDLFTVESVDLGIFDLLQAGYLGNTLYLVVVGGFFSVLFALPSAFIVTHFDFPYRRTLQWLLMMPMSVPSYIGAFVLVDTISPTYTDSFLAPIRILMVDVIRGGLGVSLVVSLTLYPYIYLIMKNLFINQSGRLLEVSRVYGYNFWRYFFLSVLPVSYPALVSGLILISLEIFGEFGTPLYFGYHTITTNIYVMWGTHGDVLSSVRLALILIFFMSIILFCEQYFSLGRSNYSLKHLVSSAKRTRIEFFNFKGWMMFLWCLLPISLGFFLPLLRLSYLFMANIDNQIPLSDLFGQLFTSFFLGICSGFLVILLSLFFLPFSSLGLISFRAKQSWLLRYGYGVPGLVMALGVLILFGSIDLFLTEKLGITSGQILGGGYLGMIYVYVLRFAALGSRSLHDSFHGMNKRCLDMGRILGFSFMDRVRYIFYPFMRGGVLVGLLLVMVEVFKELPATMLLLPLGVETLSTGIYQWGGDEMLERVALGCLFMICISAFPVYILIGKIENFGDKDL